MKYIKLTKDEGKILKDFADGKFKSVDNLMAQKKEYQGIAKATLNKARNINIRTSERDFQKIKARAAELGIPYQTLISSLIHRSL